MQLNRRNFLKTKLSLGAGLVIGVPILAKRSALLARDGEESDSQLKPSAWVKIAPDNRIEIYMAKAEMGQGVYSNLPMLIAEEMDADWSQVSIELVAELGEFAPPAGQLAATFGSTSVRNNYELFRKVGAAIRELFSEAAARRLQVEQHDLKTADSYVILNDAVRLSYGELLEDAAALLPLKPDPKLKSVDAFKLIGKSTPRKDVPLKIRGEATFGIDASLPDMRYAAIRQNPVFGSEITNQGDLLQQIPADIDLCFVPGAVIAIADSYWTAEQGLQKLKIEYKVPDASRTIDNQWLQRRLLEELDKDAEVAEQDGSLPDTSEDVLSYKADYIVPYLAHATMEPMNCVVHVGEGFCKVIAPTQSAQLIQFALAGVLGMAPFQIEVTPTFLGGGFGRKVETDFVVQAALASRAVGSPVKLIWSRREDTTHDFYRPAFAARMEALIEGQRLVGWRAKSTGASPMKRQNPDIKVDPLSIDGFVDLVYDLPARDIRYRHWDAGIPVGFWRSVGMSQNCFFVESFLDELASQLQQDPLALRLSLLTNNPRASSVLQKAADMASWSKSEAPQGLAVTRSHGSYIAAIVELAPKGNRWTVSRIYAVIDCGFAINPENVKAQIRSGILFGLAATLYGDLPLRAGQVSFDNFVASTNVRLANAPDIDVEVVSNANAQLGGVGEPGTAIIAPAVVNAFRRASGQMIRSLPLTQFGLV